MRLLAEHMLPGQKRRFHLLVMMLMRRCHIHGIDGIEETVVIAERRGEPRLARERPRTLLARVEDGDELLAADARSFGDEASRDAPRSHDAQTDFGEARVAQRRRGDARGARQIHDLAKALQIVEVPDPIGPEHHDVDAPRLDVVDLLANIRLGNDLVGKSTVDDRLITNGIGIGGVQLAANLIEMVRGHPHDEIVPQRLRATK